MTVKTFSPADVHELMRLAQWAADTVEAQAAALAEKDAALRSLQEKVQKLRHWLVGVGCQGLMPFAAKHAFIERVNSKMDTLGLPAETPRQEPAT